MDEIKKYLLEADPWWLLLSMLLGLSSHISRSLRWALLIKPLGYKPRKKTLFFSVMIMYLTNYAIPRSGEVVRAGIVGKYEKIPFTALLGTIITERAIDVVMLFLLTLVVIFTQTKVVLSFAKTHGGLATLEHSAVLIFIILASFIILLLLLYIFRKKIKQTVLYNKFRKIIDDFVNGLKSVKNVDRKLEFFLHTIYIWAMYFIMIYVVFKAFPFTSHLSLITGLTVFVIASFGMVFPSPGGIGTWHFLAIETLFIYGIDKVQGRAFAFAAHESQMIMLISIGLLSLLATSAIKIRDSKIIKT